MEQNKIQNMWYTSQTTYEQCIPWWFKKREKAYFFDVGLDLGLCAFTSEGMRNDADRSFSMSSPSKYTGSVSLALKCCKIISIRSR